MEHRLWSNTEFQTRESYKITRVFIEFNMEFDCFNDIKTLFEILYMLIPFISIEKSNRLRIICLAICSNLKNIRYK